MPNFIEEIIEKDLESGAVKQIVTRFPPEPNGYLHIGHAKAICLNYYGTAVAYKGKCNLRFDDTNPMKEEEAFCNSIIEDMQWLGWKGDIYYASDYFETMYVCAVKLIQKGKAYVDDISAEKMRELRGTLTQPGIESGCRSRPAEESLALFEEMKNGLIADGALVLRAKIDMQSPNLNMRDPVLYRVLNVPHHRQGEKWCIYPMYDFAHPIEDAVEGVTHSLCSLEFEDHRPLYDWVIRECELSPAPHQYEFARLNIERTIMSKRYLKKLVEEGVVDGWDDPRMPTLAGLRRRGYTASAIRTFTERIGVAKANSTVETGQLESCIREELNAEAERAMAVLDPVKLVLTNRPETYTEQLDFETNPNAKRIKTRKVTISNELYIERSDFMIDPPKKYHRLVPDGMVRLKSAFIIQCEGYELAPDGTVQTVFAKILEDTKSGSDQSGIKVKGVIHWVDAKNCVDIEARLYDYLLLPEEADKQDFSTRINPSSLSVRRAKGEKILGGKKMRPYQFLRHGYFVRDSKNADGMVYNMVVGLKDSYNK